MKKPRRCCGRAHDKTIRNFLARSRMFCAHDSGIVLAIGELVTHATDGMKVLRITGIGFKVFTESENKIIDRPG